jgi:hypothetical protein
VKPLIPTAALVTSEGTVVSVRSLTEHMLMAELAPHRELIVSALKVR